MTKPNIRSYHFDHMRQKSGNKNFVDNYDKAKGDKTEVWLYWTFKSSVEYDKFVLFFK